MSASGGGKNIEPVAVLVRGRTRAHVMWLGRYEQTLPNGMNLYASDVVYELRNQLSEVWRAFNELEKANASLQEQVYALSGDTK